jgi:hypothetical protein
MRAIPNSIYRLTSHEESVGKLRQLIEDSNKTSNKNSNILNSSHSGGEKIKKIEIRLTKAIKKSGTSLINFNKKEESKKEGTMFKDSQRSDFSQKDLFESMFKHNN